MEVFHWESSLEKGRAFCRGGQRRMQELRLGWLKDTNQDALCKIPVCHYCNTNQDGVV